jgi:diguanylate cyclase (GGDEF)-like protein
MLSSLIKVARTTLSGGPTIRLRLILLWPLVSLFLAVVGMLFLASKLEEDKAESMARIQKTLNVLVRAYAEDTEQALDAVDRTLLLLRFQWIQSPTGIPLETMRSDGIFTKRAPFNASILDRHGTRVTSTFPLDLKGAMDRGLADQSYFVDQKFAQQDRVFVGRPAVGRSTGRLVIHFSRRLIDREEQFAGVVHIGVQATYFTTHYDPTTLGSFGMLGMFGPEGLARVVRSGDTVQSTGTELLSNPLSLEGGSGSMFASGAAFRDGRNRYLAWQAIEDYGVIALVGLDEEESLAPYNAARLAATHQAGVALLFLLAFTLVAMSLSLRIAWQKRLQELAAGTYRAATEGAADGFYIVRPVDHGSDETGDFCVIDCNERGAALFNMKSIEMKGRTLSSILGKNAFPEAEKMLDNAFRDGSFAGEWWRRTADADRMRCLDVKILRSQSDFAVTLRDVTRERQHLRELERQGNEDSLTGLPNRNWAQKYLPRAVSQAASRSQSMALLFIDLDGFKSVNDRLGHGAGDEALRMSARRLREAVRPNDMVARLGGDEFIVILENVLHNDDVRQVAERVRESFSREFQLSIGSSSLGASIGISVYPTDAADATALMENADFAMYAAKTAGKNRYCFFDPSFSESVRKRVELEAELKRAIASDEFVLHYQPRVALSTGRTCGFEALLRWEHPARGLLEPAAFLWLAEETGLIVPLGELVIGKVCKQIGLWSRNEEICIPVSINVSARQFDEASVCDLLDDCVSRYGISNELVEIEMTESVMLANPAGARAKLNEMRKAGITLLIDDFGTGYSSLSQLQELDFDVLKIDGTFTNRLHAAGPAGCVFYEAIITMAHTLGMRVVAEGVEQLGEMQVLKELRCDEIQGFYVCPAMPAKARQSEMAHTVEV